MTLNDLKAAYCARHRMSLDDSAVLHLNGFVQFVESALASLDMAEGDAAVPAEPAAGTEGEKPGAEGGQEPSETPGAAAEPAAAPADGQAEAVTGEVAPQAAADGQSGPEAPAAGSGQPESPAPAGEAQQDSAA